MADAAYDNYKDILLGGGTNPGLVDLDTDDIRIVLIDEGTDAPVLATDDALDDITVGARVATSTNLAAKTVGTVAAGVFDHDNYTFATVSGSSIESYTYYKHTGTESTSPLLVNIDAATGLPVTPNNGDITISVNTSGAWAI